MAELRDNISGAIGDVLPGLLSCVPDAVAQVSAFVAGTFIALFNPFERMPSASCA